jgi:hypothetical protein
MNKRIVQFSRRAGVTILGNRAFLKPIDHPDSDNVSNLKYVITSEVIDKEVYCCRIIALETVNTIYKEFDDGEYLG